MVVWEKTLPYNVPSARPTSAWVKPNLIRRCLNCLAKDSRSSEKQASARYYYLLSWKDFKKKLEIGFRNKQWSILNEVFLQIQFGRDAEL